MSIVHRRVFYGKVGTADQLIAHLQEGYKLLHQLPGVDLKSRVLSDHMSGRTDRVVTEEEADDLGKIEAAYNQAMSSPEARAWFQPWMEKLTQLIHYAEAENWSVH